jgi:hypothetical protein
MRKTPLQQLLIHPPNLLEFGKSPRVPLLSRAYLLSPRVFVGQSKGERAWKE